MFLSITLTTTERESLPVQWLGEALADFRDPERPKVPRLFLLLDR